MTVVVILIMIAFVGGAALQQILKRIGAGAQTVAYFGEKGEINGRDILTAQSDLNVLRVLMFDRMLHFGIGDLNSRLLGQLLFPVSGIATATSNELKQAAMQGRFQASAKEIDAFFAQATGRSEYLWILLRHEAQQAGCAVTNNQAKEILRQIVPQLTQGQADARQLVDLIIQNRNVPEKEILRIVADLWSVIAYTRMVTSGEDVTISQLKAEIGREGEKVNAEFVKINASDFVAAEPEPTPEELNELFDLYKGFLPGRITDENPYGFGYKLPARVEVEYLIIKQEDVRALVAEPTANEMETFYRLNLDLPEYQTLFKYDEQIDPNDPESKVQKTKSYAEVAGQIKQVMTLTETNRKADMILNEAMGLTEAGFAGIETNTAGAAELSALAADYKQAAAAISEKYDIKVYTGKTGMLSAADAALDRYLGRLSVEGQEQQKVPVGTIVFALDELDAVPAGTLSGRRSKMWQNIGPAKDMFGSTLAILRVVRAEKASEPADVAFSFNKDGIILDETGQSEKIYSVSDQVAADVKLQKAMRTAKASAAELVELIKEKDWTEALNQFNESQTTSTVKLDTLSNQSRLSRLDIQAARTQAGDNPMGAGFVRRRIETKKLLDKLYSMLPADKTEAKNLASLLEFKPGACYYVVKSVSRTAVTRQDYLQKKSRTAFMLDSVRSESLLLIHLRPDNIFERTNFKFVTRDSSPAQDQQQQAGGA
ncbi:MAG: hypothetical protein ACYTFK_05150 [Planctomycetota bacterium]